MTGNIPAESQWEIARLGKFTSSQIDALFTEPRSKEAKVKGELSESAKTYIKSKAAEIVTGTTRQVTNWATEWGNTYEPMAAEKLALRYPGMEYMGKENPRFFPYSDFSGGSPDGWHQELGLNFEVKCPEDPANHVEYCLMETSEDLKDARLEYYHQVQMNMICIAKEFKIPFKEMKTVFCSYCPIINDPYQDIYTLIIEPDIEFSARLPKVIERAESYLAEIVWALNRNNMGRLLAAPDDSLPYEMILEDADALKI